MLRHMQLLTNDTEVGFNVGFGFGFDLLKNIPIIDDTLSHADGTLPVASLDVFSDTFDFKFPSETYSFIVA